MLKKRGRGRGRGRGTDRGTGRVGKVAKEAVTTLDLVLPRP